MFLKDGCDFLIEQCTDRGWVALRRKTEYNKVWFITYHAGRICAEAALQIIRMTGYRN